MLLMVLAMADAPEDKKKLESLFLLYEKMMYRIAYNILHHHQDAEDALMTAWEKIASNLKKINEIDCPQTKSFIVIIVERTAIDLYRKNQRKRDAESLVDIYEESPVFLTRDKSFEDAELYEVFRQLPKQYGEVLTYHYMNSLPSLVYRCLSFLSRCSMRLTKISCFQGIFHLLFSPKYAILFS